MAGKLPLSASISFESIDEEDLQQCLTLFDDLLKRVGILASPRTLLRMRVEKVELPWSKLRFELMTKTNLFGACCMKVLALPGVTDLMH